MERKSKRELASALAALMFVTQSAFAGSCFGYTGPGGPCNAGPGGGLNAGSGGGLYAGPGGGLYAGPLKQIQFRTCVPNMELSLHRIPNCPRAP